jgi:hypothetical protein
MAITLLNYYDQYSEGNNTGLYSQPGGPTIPNPNDPNNNSTAQYGGVTWGGFNNNGTNPAPLITVPVTQGAIGNSGEGLLSSLAGGGLSSIPGVGGLGGGLLNIVDGATGGIVEELAAGALDAARITKFLATPQGIAFNLKQVWLQAMNTKVPHKGLNNDTRIYNLGINTLLQVPLEAIDIHIERHGLFPSFQEYPNNKGVYSQYFKDHETEFDSSLYNLSQTSVRPGSDLFSYGGGPKSKFGIGRTSHKRWIDSQDITEGVIARPLPDIDIPISSPSSVPIISSTALSGLPRNLKELENEDLGLPIGKGIGRVGSRNREERKNLYLEKPQTRDIVNYTPLQKAVTEDATEQLELEQDLVNFRFESIDNDSPKKSIFIIFRSFLSSITDNYSPTWNPHKYLGRGEKVYTYSGFDRSISFSFKTAVQTREETKPIIQKLNFLASNTAPDFNTAGRMRGPFMRLTIGDYFVSVPGFISSLTYTIDDSSPWDIALYKDENVVDIFEERQLPHIINVQVSYTPIHDFLPRKGTNNVHYMLGKQDPWITSVPSIEDDWKKRIPPLTPPNPINPLPLPQPLPTQLNTNGMRNEIQTIGISSPPQGNSITTISTIGQPDERMMQQLNNPNSSLSDDENALRRLLDQ